ncbi:hypothetical protein GCM10023116_05000 [Kistimonas scapharcae]|uniref:Polymerase nucleotidyl transferase domain-containing protein n=1 Tax=Kistimonas scapharcae TaxID=1036133 RepID=A0ABP8UYH6_9GAMM
MQLDVFIDELKSISDKDDILDFCRKKVLHGTPFVFRDRENDFYDFQKRISLQFNVAFHEVYITGSGKLGFSPLKKKEFDLDSDIDVAIISGDLFDNILELIRNYQMSLRASKRNVSEQEIKLYHQFLEYVAIGWIRPDKLPLSFQIENLKNAWFDFFDSISYGRSEVGDYKVTAGIFKSYRHFELYTFSGINDLNKSLNLSS